MGELNSSVNAVYQFVIFGLGRLNIAYSFLIDH